MSIEEIKEALTELGFILSEIEVAAENTKIKYSKYTIIAEFAGYGSIIVRRNLMESENKADEKLKAWLWMFDAIIEKLSYRMNLKNKIAVVKIITADQDTT